MTLPLLDQDLYGCVSPAGYGYGRGDGSPLPRLRGRSRMVLRDNRPRIQFNVSIVMTDAQFAGWQTFWAGPAEHGAKPFRMRLRVDLLPVYQSGIEIYEVNAKSPWSATYSAAGIWDVTLQLTAPALKLLAPVDCDEIYGGPLDDLSPDEIYGGPLDNLSSDVIDPCREILG